MICEHLPALLGMKCHQLTEDGTVAVVESPFEFEDGDGLPVFAEDLGDAVRFFDDGVVIQHFIGRGVTLRDKKDAEFLITAATAYGVSLNDQGEFEIFGSAADPAPAFASYINALLAIVSWEKDQCGTGACASTSHITH